jgi:hypothetical protein
MTEYLLIKEHGREIVLNLERTRLAESFGFGIALYELENVDGAMYNYMHKGLVNTKEKALAWLNGEDVKRITIYARST